MRIVVVDFLTTAMPICDGYDGVILRTFGFPPWSAIDNIDWKLFFTVCYKFNSKAWRMQGFNY